jgi:hypothetical protein
MDLSGMIGSIYNTNMQLPLQYGNMYNNMYNPMYGYGQSQAGNMAQLGGQAMGLYGNLAGQQASMYQSELPFQMQQQQWNSLAPVLGGLLGQFGMGGGASISPINMSFNRPNVMSGYQGAVGNAYSNARGYDGWMQNNFTQHSGMMPQMPQPQGGGGGQTFGGYVPQNPPPAGASASKPKGGSASSGPIKQLF